MNPSKIKSVVVRKFRIPTDPSIDVFDVTVKYEGGEAIWKETPKNEDELKMFLQGLRAGSPHLIPIVEIPRNSEPLPDPASV